MKMPDSTKKIVLKNLGVYLPRFRITGKVLSEAWHKPMGKGTKTVPNFDEDSLTMAVGASVKAVDNSGGSDKLDALYFASTTAPYDEKSSASLIAAAVDLPAGVRTMDFGGSLRSGTSALISAFEAVTAGRLSNIIVTASDSRFAEPGSDLEPMIGAGGAALIISDNAAEGALEVTDYETSAGDLTDYWRRNDDRYIHHSDLKYAMIYGATKTVVDTIKSFIEKTGRNLTEFHKIILSVPDGRSARTIAKQLKISPEQLQDNFVGQIGLVGSAQSFIMLTEAASISPAGSEILLANYGDGCDIICFKKLSKGPGGQPESIVSEALAGASELASYTKYLSYHNLIRDSTQNLTSEPFSSTILSYREESRNIRLHGKQCKNCSTIHTLDLSVCPHCSTHENFEDFKLKRTGTINTYTQEYYYPTPEPPVTMAVIDLEGGGRILAQMTDTDAGVVSVGMKVELTFRKLHQGAQFVNYCWKCRAVEIPVKTDAKSRGGS
jgi:3-hydroxy-3-methylglutaryl CoA synthase